MPCRILSVVSGSVRALWWSDDAAVSGALVVRAERKAAPCGALHAAVARHGMTINRLQIFKVVSFKITNW